MIKALYLVPILITLKLLLILNGGENSQNIIDICKIKYLPMAMHLSILLKSMSQILNNIS